MKKIFLLPLLGLAACAKCYDGRFSETTMTNQIGNDVELVVCREDSPTTHKTVTFLANQVKTFQWGDTEKINEKTEFDNCPNDHKDEHVQIKARLATNSQTLARLCLKTDGNYELIPANQFCTTDKTEITAACQ